jgi:multidrug efflux pump subunit AcrA (membrane-fusion protein)
MSRRWLFLMLATSAVLCGAGAVYLKQRPTGSAALLAGSPGASDARPVDWKIICTGRVETVHGEVDVCAQIAGLLAEVRVQDGEAVNEGDILAILEGGREAAELEVARAAVELARARLVQIQAGNGQEEIDEARFELESIEALLAYETASLERARKLHASNAVSPDTLDQKRQRVEQLTRQCASLKQRHAALVRGPLPEEIAVARAELASAEERHRRAAVENEYRFVRAPMAGVIVKIYRHTGDSVLVEQPCPIVRLADPSRLRVRLEIDEADVPRLHTDMQGTFCVPGVAGEAGRLTVRTIVPVFSPTRLFNPDTTARQDNRVLDVLCEPGESSVPLYPGQRVRAVFHMPTGKS